MLKLVINGEGRVQIIRYILLVSSYIIIHVQFVTVGLVRQTVFSVQLTTRPHSLKSLMIRQKGGS